MPTSDSSTAVPRQGLAPNAYDVAAEFSSGDTLLNGKTYLFGLPPTSATGFKFRVGIYDKIKDSWALPCGGGIHYQLRSSNEIWLLASSWPEAEARAYQRCALRTAGLI